MAPKAAPKANGPAAKAKAAPGRQDGKIPNRKMDAPAKKDGKVDEKEDKTAKLMALRAAKKIQRYCKGMRVLSAMQAIHILEDVVLMVPTPGGEALEAILAGPKLPTDEELASNASEVSASPTHAETAMASGARYDSSRPGSADGQSRVSGPGSRAGGTSSASSGTGEHDSGDDSSTDDEERPHITEHMLARQLKMWDIHETHRTASLIFWLLGRQGEVLFAEDLERVHRHHRIRRRNANSKVQLYLVLVQHGDAVQSSISMRPCTAGPLPNDGPRPLDPAGWEQVTRIAWALRLCPPWSSPGLVLTASSQCSLETSDRLYRVLEEPHHYEIRDCGLEIHHDHHRDHHDHHDHHHGHHHDHSHDHDHDHHHHRRCPPPTVCDPLDFPRVHALLGPTNYYVAEEVAALILATENPNRKSKKKPKEAPPVLIVAGGSVVETMLACLTSGRPREELLTARLRGGDAVLLSSPVMCSIVGEDLDERWRPSSNLWEEAMKRDDWTIAHHLRGDGTGQPVELGGAPVAEKIEQAEFKSNLTDQWNAYAGAALILTDSQYLDIRKRAGKDQSTGLGLDPALSKTLRPLVKDYVIPDAQVEGSQENAPPGAQDKGSRNGQMGRLGSKGKANRRTSKQAH